MPSATPQPQLKKKASLRDRLRAWQKPGEALETVTDEPKQRFIYEPKHAAADFSRLAVSPVSPVRPRFAPPMQPLCEDGVPMFHQAGQRNRDDDGRPPKDDKPTRRLSRHGSQHHHSYAVAEDPFQASNTAVHVPVNSRPVAWTPTAQSVEQRTQDPAPSQPLSDYELFIARAEAEDRERRERILRSISQRSAAYSASRVKPDPHRQFASAGSSSAGRTRDTSQQRNSGSRYVLGSSGNGGEQNKQQEQAGKGHGWRPSWASSTATGGSGPERGLEKEEARHVRPPPRARAQQRRPKPESGPVQQPPVVYGVDEKFDQAREYQPQQTRTLRRQASLTKRIVDYIRPPKTAVRPVETVVE
ncbi:uncharacterized protein B0T15DRAFT_138235 [Chaetomium strumarium]|uniref:Uncharacterized protein n=1 Tax=Chaetomium strumarium TaxID=1170767 RepID=A0AAJ0M277_9PEZI|nr:hypothetical protein B0T15DRAFT_138235 [Chaetomium strumarium]